MNLQSKFKKTNELVLTTSPLGLYFINTLLKKEHPNQATQIQAVVEILAFKLFHLTSIIREPTKVIRRTAEAREFSKKYLYNLPRTKYEHQLWPILEKTNGNWNEEASELSDQYEQEYLAKGYHWNRSRFNHYLEKAYTLFPEYLQELRKMHLEQAFYDAGPRSYHIPESLGPKLYMRFMDLNDMYTIDEFEELFNALYADIQTELNLLDQFENGEEPDVSWYVEYKRGYNEDDGDHYLETLITRPEYE